MFSSRVPSERIPNPLTLAIRRARAAGRALIDLTITNPTVAGFDYPADLLEPLALPDGRHYAPEPLGLASARTAVAADYARRNRAIAPERIALTASTSEAYSLLFKLLCDAAGDRVLVPVPSYPLFDHLTRLDGVIPVPYRLEYHGRWSVDWDSLDNGWSDDVRGVLAVSPNNPTGSSLTADEMRKLEYRCASRDAALIVDEVFADYSFEDETAAAAPRHGSRCLTFRLGGLSKSVGLPQVKLGWIAVEGPDQLVDEAMERLELVCDTYLSVSTPVQLAAPTLMTRGAAVREQIRMRVRENYAALRALSLRHPAVDVLNADAGWAAVMRVPSTRSEEELVLELLAQDGVIVHPGFFFDFPHEAFLVLSLLAEPGAFREGIRRMMERVDG